MESDVSRKGEFLCFKAVIRAETKEVKAWLYLTLAESLYLARYTTALKLSKAAEIAIR